ncbi:ribonuclease-like [Eublepharis macularius]|uniref:Ribonuclease-like n=1 Tax=Eublepharis macularius TaxID=481883 RepID=A0AA97K7Q7_EUBMA|nr:ribonuclease-like [Eublepharis macularius]
MSLKGPHPGILYLLLLGMAACLMVHGQSAGFEGFLKRHVENPKSDFGNDNNYCYQMMRRRGLNCQRSNTFIHANQEQLKSICSSRGQILHGNQISKTLFPITICKLKRRLRRLVCRYKGKSKIRRIRVTCEKGLPVHYISSV